MLDNFIEMFAYLYNRLIHNYRFQLHRMTYIILINIRILFVLLIFVCVEQGPTALAVGAGGVVWTFFSRLSFLFSFSLSLGDGPI